MHLGFLTVWGLVFGALAGAVMSNLWLFCILIVASGLSSVVVGKISEAQITKRINSENRQLKTKITDLQAEIDRLKEHFGINDEF